MKSFTQTAAALIAFSVSSTAAFAHGEEKHATDVGQKGDPVKVSRTIEVSMTDNAFEPSSMAVKAGETIRFVVRNDGELVHEFNIGTGKMHEAHREEMMQMMDMGMLEADRINHDRMGHGSGGMMMKHDDPNSVLLEPQQTAELIWMFPERANLQFACNVPGHYEDGMVGEFRIDGGPGS